MAPIADPCTKGFQKAKASRWTAWLPKLTEGISKFAYGRCLTAAATANHILRPATGSPQPLPLQSPCYGLSAVSAWTVMLQLSAPLYGAVVGSLACPLLAISSALISASQPLQLTYLGCIMQTYKDALQSPSASCPAGVFLSPIIHFAVSIYNMYMDTMATMTSWAISSWVAANTLPVCESPTPELCPVCTPPCQLPFMLHTCCPTAWLCLAPPKPICLHTSCVCQHS